MKHRLIKDFRQRWYVIESQQERVFYDWEAAFEEGEKPKGHDFNKNVSSGPDCVTFDRFEERPD